MVTLHSHCDGSSCEVVLILVGTGDDDNSSDGDGKVVANSTWVVSEHSKNRKVSQWFDNCTLDTLLLAVVVVMSCSLIHSYHYWWYLPMQFHMELRMNIEY